jgi:hypothetical protein
MGLKVTRRKQRKARSTRRKQRGGVGGKPSDMSAWLEEHNKMIMAQRAALAQGATGLWEREEHAKEQLLARNLYPGFTETFNSDEYNTSKLTFLYHAIEQVINSEFKGKSKERMLRILGLLRRQYSIDTPSVYTVTINEPEYKTALTKVIKLKLENEGDEMATLLQELYVSFNPLFSVTE